MQTLNLDTKNYFSLLPFSYNGESLLEDAPLWGMTLEKTGSMRFRWNEENKNREFLKTIFPQKKIVPLELLHSKIVYDVKNHSDTEYKQGDGIITQNKNLVPSITVADCMPIFLFCVKTKVFGIVHSGWQGTGIIKEAINLAKKNYGATEQSICVALGPHIHSCCYIVTKDRAEYFSKNFTSRCIKKYESSGTKIENWNKTNCNKTNQELYALSLKEANLFILEKLKIPEKNILVSDDCTCCNEQFGSFRRETFNTPNSQDFTVQAAFCGYV